jgi:hypothetical protein
MGGLFLIGLLILLAVKFWPYLLALGGLWLVWRCAVVPMRHDHAREIREQLRHEAARRDIDRIAAETTRAMYVAATQVDGAVVEGTAVEVEQ